MIAKIINGKYLRKALQVLHDEGICSLINKTRNKITDSNEFDKLMKKADSQKAIEISIVIPVYNAFTYTKECIDKIYTVGSNHDFEVIVVDNASSDETQAEMETESLERSDFSYYRLDENHGFSGGVNFGIQKARGRYVVILNNDTLPTAGWLDKLVKALMDDPTIGIVSPVTNYVGEGSQLEFAAQDIQAKDIDSYGSSLNGRGVYYEPGRLVFFCVMIRRSVIDQIGLLDEAYIKGNFEDDDYCLRAILSGYKLAVSKNSFVFHHGSITFKKNRIAHSDHMELNRKRFYLKTGGLAVSERVPFERTKNPQVSVIVRTKDRKHLLEKALVSLTNQTFRHFEVVLVNDGGETVKNLVEQFSVHFPITYINHEIPKGRTSALNAGVSKANTKWLAFLDDDDIVYPSHLATLHNHTLLGPDARMFYSNYNRTLFRTTHDHSPVFLKSVEPWSYNQDQLWVSNHVPIHSWLISKECFENVGLFDEKQEMLEDFEFLVRLSKKYDFVHVDRVTCEYRFYLDGMNSMIKSREKTQAALEYIFEKHAAYNTQIANARKVELASLKRQIEQIEDIKLLLTDDTESNNHVMRRIAQLILGL